MKKVLTLLLFFISSMVCFGQAEKDSVGIYAVQDGQLTRMRPIRYMQTKVKGGLFVAKAKLKFKGSMSDTRFQDKAVFRIYFSDDKYGADSNYFMFDASANIDEIGVYSFDVKKGFRWLTSMKASAFRLKQGVEEDHSFLNVETKEIRHNVYEVTVSGESGEFCIASMAHGLAGYTNVFDFGIDF